MILPGVWGFVGTPFSEDVAVVVGNTYYSMEHNSQGIKTCTCYLIPHNSNNILNHSPIIQISRLCVVGGRKLLSTRWLQYSFRGIGSGILH